MKDLMLMLVYSIKNHVGTNNGLISSVNAHLILSYDNVSRKHAGPWPINGRTNSNGISELGSQFESPTKPQSP